MVKCSTETNQILANEDKGIENTDVNVNMSKGSTITIIYAYIPPGNPLREKGLDSFLGKLIQVLCRNRRAIKTPSSRSSKPFKNQEP